MSHIDQYINEYPHPFFVIKPIMENNKCVDFTYIFVNNSFRNFLGLNKEEMINSNFSDFFDKEKAEKSWLEAFKNAAIGKKYQVVNQDSNIIDKKMCLEVFHIEPNLCGCIIRDYSTKGGDQLYGDLMHKAYMDNLTGLYNRFYLQETLAKINDMVNVGLAVLDVNKLKIINDTFGHQAGDDAIKKVSNILQKFFPNESLYRIGGDEFLVLIDNVLEDGFKKICAEVEDDLNNAAAIGFKYYQHVQSFKDAFHECDSLMYENKLEKRNQ